MIIHCSFCTEFGKKTPNISYMYWVMHRTVDDFFRQWQLGCKFVRKNILWKLVWYASLWKLWLERNNRVFDNKRKSVDAIVDSIVWSVLEWVCKRKEFQGIIFDDP